MAVTMGGEITFLFFDFMCHFNLLHIQTLGEFILIFYEDKHIVWSVKKLCIHNCWKIWVLVGAVSFNPLNVELNPVCHLLALLGVHHFLHISRIRVKSLTLRLLMSYIYIYIYIWSAYSWCFLIRHNDAPQSLGLL